LHKVDIAFISSNKSDASELQIVIEKILYGDSQELPQPYNPTSELANYIYPDVTFHTKYAQDIYLPNSEINQNIECILNILAGFDIKAEFIGVDKGHIVSVYKFTVDATKQVKLQRNVKEISSFIRPNGIRIYSSFNSLGEVNIEIPNNEPSFVSDTPVVPQEEDIIATFGELPGGKPFRVDLTDLGHIAIFGDMGTGKTALLDNILMSLLMSKHPAYIKFIVFSNSVLDFTYIDRLKNIFGIETSAGDLKMSSSAKAETIMRAISFEIDHRIQLLRTANCPCITDYNRLFCNHGLKPTDGHHYLPYIIVVIDEIQDYMGINGCNLETLITSVLPNALNVGCIFIVTTKYTNRKTISIFNQYFSTKVAFNMSQFNIDNANSLMSHNDALLHNKDNITRFQPTIFSDTLRDYIVEHIAMQQYFATPKPYILSESTQNSSSNNCIWDRMDDKFKDAARIVVSSNLASVSTSTLQRYMGIGYNKAGKIMDQLEVAGIVGPTSGGKPRAVLVDSTQLEQILSKY
jgi:S-DNA-T family DNA segregation ATPase FtsK/SpoIIIE